MIFSENRYPLFRIMLQRGIQYAAASRFDLDVSGILDGPVKPDDDSWRYFSAKKPAHPGCMGDTWPRARGCSRTSCAGKVLRAHRSSAVPQTDTSNTGSALPRDRLFYDPWNRDSRRRGIRAWHGRSRISFHSEPHPEPSFIPPLTNPLSS